MNSKAKPVLRWKIGMAAAVLISVLVFMTTLSAGSAISPSSTRTPVNIGTAGNYVIFADAGISSTGTTTIVGDVGTTSAASYITGNFALALVSPPGEYSISALVAGKVYAFDYAAPTPTKMTTASCDKLTAYTDAAGRVTPDGTDLYSGAIGGHTFAAGLYKWATGVTISSDVTLAGNSTDVWIFQIAGTLISNTATHVILSGGAQARNVFWQVAGATTLGTYSFFKGIILCASTIAMTTGASFEGRALSATDVTLDSNAITAPAAAGTPPPIDTPGAISGFPVVIFACFLMLGITYSMISRRKSLKNATA